jgi:hypothetical protein
MIWAYPHEVTVSHRLTLHVSTAAPAFRVDAYRQGARLEYVGCLGTDLPGLNLPFGGPAAAWAWPRFDFDIEPNWRAGVYVAVLSPLGDGFRGFVGDPPDLSATSGMALFIVERPVEASILYKLPTFTYQAYNGTGYGSLYAEAVWSHRVPAGFRATMQRPGGGVGGVVMAGDSPDFYRPGSRRQSFAHWDAPFISWLERSGYDVAYCSDLDIHRDPSRLGRNHLLLSVGHDEYWTDEIRHAIEAFLDDGGNVAFFSGNIAGWRVELADSETSLVCAKVPPSSGDVSRGKKWRIDRWQDFDPENRITGVSFHQAAGLWDGKRPNVGYTVEAPEHWVFADTGLAAGDVIGAGSDVPLIGYEADGTPFLRRHNVAIPTGDQSTPDNFTILATAHLGEEWSSRGARATATAGTYSTSNGGIVFQAATTDWPIVAIEDATIERITKNVLDCLRHKSVPVLGPYPLLAGVGRGVVGRVATFAAGIGQLPSRNWNEVSYRWRIGRELHDTKVPTIAFEVPSLPCPLSVSVEVLADSRVIAFGASTTVTLTPEEATRVQIIHLLRELAAPGDPSGTLVQPTRDALESALEINRVNIPWMAERAAFLVPLLEMLLSQLAKPGDQAEERYLEDIRRVLAEGKSCAP